MTLRYPVFWLLLYSSIVVLTEASFAEPILEEVIVTAERRDASLQQTPIAITTFSPAQIEASNIDNIQDISAYTPGLLMGNSSGVSTPEVYIRGVGTNDFSIASDTSVGFYIDDVYIGREAGEVVNLFDTTQLSNIL